MMFGRVMRDRGGAMTASATDSPLLYRRVVPPEGNMFLLPFRYLHHILRQIIHGGIP